MKVAFVILFLLSISVCSGEYVKDKEQKRSSTPNSKPKPKSKPKPSLNPKPPPPPMNGIPLNMTEGLPEDVSTVNTSILLSFHQIHGDKLNHSFTYASFMGSLSFLPALEVFLYTLNETSPSFPFSLCIALIDGYREIAEVALRVLSKYKSTLSYRIYLWPLIPSPQNGHERARWSINWTKLQLWTMYEFEKIFYVDLDVIFMRNVDQVFDESRFPVDRFLGTYDWGRSTPVGTPKLNGGVFLLRPLKETFFLLLTSRHHINLYRSVEAEQGLFNYHFSNSSGCCLPCYFNVQKTVSVHIPSIWHPGMMFILHFTGEKPWNSWSSRRFREIYVPKSEIQARAASDTWDASNYESLHNLWKRKYIEARSDELSSQLTVFQGYHSEKCWPHLYNDTWYRHVRLAGPHRNTSFDIDAPHLYSPLRHDQDLQLALGEFGAKLAVARLSKEKLPPYIGFTSWKEYMKADWREGASIDWTKIKLKPNTFYFWYSLRNHLPFYETVEEHHENMARRVLADPDIFPFPLPLMDGQSLSNSLLTNPSSATNTTHRYFPYYMYSNYFITSKELFLSYMNDAEALMKRFLAKYPMSGPCPYSLPTDVLHPEKRCFGYLLERYINIWAVSKNVSLVYAVDHPEWRNQGNWKLKKKYDISPPI
jgi:lipopolysaccharide biosynthesis glycosyltransferase